MRPREPRRSKGDPVGAFLGQLALLKLPPAEREYRFHPQRCWLLDVAWPAERIAVEYQGVFGGAGRNASHASVAKLLRDYRKWTQASLLGWLLILIDAKSVETGEAHGWVELAFALRRGAAQANNAATGNVAQNTEVL